MKVWSRGILVTLVLLLSGCGQQQWLDHKGAGLTPDDLQGKWVVVNYWAEWCAPCLQELPEFNQLAADRSDMLVLGVNYDGVSGDALVELAERMGITFSVMGDDFAQSMKLERPQVLPTTYIFNPQGELLYSLSGPQTRSGLLELIK